MADWQDRDIIERLMDFERSGLTATDRVSIRECAAMEIFTLRQRIDCLRSQLEGLTRDDIESPAP